MGKKVHCTLFSHILNTKNCLHNVMYNNNLEIIWSLVLSKLSIKMQKKKCTSRNT